MALNKKNIVTIVLLGGMLLPFVLLTDIFPFLRFGMFAEPIRSNIQIEKFVLYKTNTDGVQSDFLSSDIGINPNTFHYLLRNYYYRNELPVFAQNTFATLDTSIQSVTILRLVTDKHSYQSDTLVLGTYNRHGISD
jgi:hypothetical protein